MEDYVLTNRYKALETALEHRLKNINTDIRVNRLKPDTKLLIQELKYSKRKVFQCLNRVRQSLRTNTMNRLEYSFLRNEYINFDYVK